MNKKNKISFDWHSLIVTITIVVLSAIGTYNSVKIRKLQDDHDLLELRIERDSIIHSHRLLNHLNGKL